MKMSEDILTNVEVSEDILPIDNSRRSTRRLYSLVELPVKSCLRAQKCRIRE